MPRLPDANDLGAVDYRSARQAVNVPTPDIAGAMNNLARGVSDVGEAALRQAQSSDEKMKLQERFDTRMGLLKAKEKIAIRVQDLDTLDPEYGNKVRGIYKETYAPVLTAVQHPENKQYFDESTYGDFVTAGVEADAAQKKAFAGKAEIDLDALTEADQRRIRNGEDPHKVLGDNLAAVNENGYIDNLSKEKIARKNRQALIVGALTHLGSGQYGKLSGGAVVRAVIGAETGGDPTAVSPKGALGLMQVMPETAAEIAAEIGDTTFLNLPEAKRKAYLQNKDVSIRYGTYYLNKMLKRYDGDLEAALIAYNAGPGRADDWIAAGRDWEAVKRANPKATWMNETQPYVGKIFGTLGIRPQQAWTDPRLLATKEDALAAVEQSPYFRELPVDEADNLKAGLLKQFKDAEEQDKSALQARKVELKTAIASDIASIADGGEPSKTLTYDDIANVLGVDDAETWRQKTSEAAVEAQVTGDFKSMSNIEVDKRVADFEVAVEQSRGKPEYSRMQAVLKNVKQRQANELALRKNRPTEAALRFDYVKQAADEYTQAVNTPTQNPNQDRNAIITAAYGKYLEATKQAQVGFGIPGGAVAMVSDEAADKIASYFLDLPAYLENKQDNINARDTVSRVYKELYNRFGDYTDQVVAYSLAKVKPLSKETSQMMVDLLGRLAKGKEIRRSMIDDVQRAQDADASDAGFMGFRDWFDSWNKPDEDTPLGTSETETIPAEDVAGAR